jgi:uncharacterized membrane protein
MKKKRTHHTSFMMKTIDYIGAVFLRGFLSLLPIALTIGLVGFFFRLIKSWLNPIYQLEPAYLKAIPHSEILLVVIFVFLVGLVFKFFLIDKLFKMLEALFSKLPLFRSIYFGAKQLIQAFTAQDKVTFQKIVYVEFPRKDVYSLGFLTSRLNPDLAPRKDVSYYNIFIPTTPNPTTGYFVVVPEDQCIFVDLTKQEAMAVIISGGIIQPTKNKKP